MADSSSGKAASHYEQLSDYQKTTGLSLVTVSGVKRGEKVLDLGCGTGHLAAVLSETVGPEGRVVAVDPDGERVKIAREKYSRLNIEFLVADDQTFPGDGYDLVFSSIAIHWIKDKMALFKRIFEKLSSSGRFAFTTFDGTPELPPNVVNILNTFAGSDFVPKFLYEKQMFVDASAYRQLAESAGLVVTSVKNTDTVLQWQNIEELIFYYHGASHGLFDISTVSKEALKEYEEKNDLGSLAVIHDMLTIVVTKP